MNGWETYTLTLCLLLHLCVKDKAETISDDVLVFCQLCLLNKSYKILINYTYRILSALLGTNTF